MASTQKQLVTSGAWLFRWRSYIPLIFLFLFIPALMEFNFPYNSHTADFIWEIFCLLISFFGLLIRCFTVCYTPRGTSGRNTKTQRADSLNTKGIYSMVRNPLYIGNYLMILGVILSMNAWYCPIIYTLLFVLYYERIIITEENYLSEKFGEEFAAYTARVPSVIPKFSLWQKSDFSFSLRNVFKREYPGFFALIVAHTVREFLGVYAVYGFFKFEAFWVNLLLFGTVVYILLRSLKKYTKILHVEGR